MKPLFLLLLLATIIFAKPLIAQHTGSMDIHDTVELKTAVVTKPSSNVDVKKKAHSALPGGTLLRSPKENMKEQVMHTYICFDHPHLRTTKPGRCADCGTLLSRTSGEKIKLEAMGLYTCTSHPHVESKKHGECSECGKALIPVKKKQALHIKKETACDNRTESGKCRSCATDPLRSSKEKMKMDVMKFCCCAANQVSRDKS